MSEPRFASRCQVWATVSVPLGELIWSSGYGWKADESFSVTELTLTDGGNRHYVRAMGFRIKKDGKPGKQYQQMASRELWEVPEKYLRPLIEEYRKGAAAAAVDIDNKCWELTKQALEAKEKRNA